MLLRRVQIVSLREKLRLFAPRQALHVFLLAILCCSLLACSSTPLVEDVSQKEANEIVALLSRHGVPAQSQRVAGGRGKYSVATDRSYYEESIILLQRYDLPRTIASPFEDLVEQQGFLPNSREIEALRIDRARSIELEELLLSHPGVKSARVVVRSASLPEGVSEGACSAVVQTEGQAPRIEILTEIIANALPGINRSYIRVAIEQAPQVQVRVDQPSGLYRSGETVVQVPLVSFLWLWRVPAGDYLRMSIALLIGIVVVLSAGGLIGYWMAYFRRSKQFFEGEYPELPVGGPRAPLGIERSPRGDGSGPPKERLS